MHFIDAVPYIFVFALAALLLLALWAPWRRTPQSMLGVTNPYPPKIVRQFANQNAADEDAAMEPLRKAIEEGRCPDCGSKAGFLSGPEGGMSQNIMCANDKCCSAFNVSAFNGQVIMLERIPNYYWNPPIKKDARGQIETAV